MSKRSAQSPLAELSPESRRALALLFGLGFAKALALIGIATAVAQGITSVINEDDAWRAAIWLGAGSALLRAAVVWATDVASARAAAGEKERLRAALNERVLARGGRDLDEGQGALAILATRGLDDLDDYFTRYLPSLVAAMVVPLVIGLRILIADWVSALIIAVTLPLVPVFMILIGTYTRDRVAEATDALTRLANHLIELARGLPVLVGLGRAEEQTRALEQISERHRARTMATLRIAFLSALALELIATISVAVVAVFIGVRLNHGTLGLETGLLVLILAPDCYLPFREVGAAHHAAQNGIEALRRVRQVIAQPLSRLIPAGVSGERTFVIHDLSVRYPGRNTPAVERFNLAVPTGSTVLLDGPSGSGKSTVLAAVAGLLGDSSASGLVVEGTVEGVDRSRIAWLSQHPATVAATVREEIALAADGNPGSVERAMAQLAIIHLAARHPSELSPGELRRVALARALVRIDGGANLLLLDEPTAHLDAESAERIIDAIASIAGAVTTLIASHDPALRQLADVRVNLAGSHAISHEPLLLSSIPGSAPSFERDQAEPEGITPAGTPGIIATLRRLNDLLGVRQPKFLVALLFGTLAALASVALTALSGWLIVRASEQPPILMLMVAIVGVRFFGIGRAVFRYLERLFTHDAVLAAASGLRIRVWNTLAAQGPAMRRRLRGDAALDSLVGDVDRLRDLTPRVLFPPLIGVATAIVAIVGTGLILPAALPVMLACAIVSLMIAPAIARWADRRHSAESIELQAKHLRQTAALFGAATDVHANGLDARATSGIRAIERELSRRMRAIASARGVAGALITLSCVAASLAMIGIARRPVADGRISEEVVAVLVLTPLALIDAFLAATTAIQQFSALETVVRRFAWLEERPARREQSNGAVVALDAPLQLIELDGVSARWPEQSKPVFRDISAELARGDWLTVTGPSGSGKSTLLAMLMAFVRPAAGTYHLNGRDATKLSPEVVRGSVAWCPQEAFLFASTLRANLLISRPRGQEPSDEEMVESLEHVGLGALLAAMPAGLDTRIGSEGSFLSGGERQRVAIARALLTGADLILIDEPTAHLDRGTADQLMADLRHASRDRIVVMVTHNSADIAPGDLRIDLRRAVPELAVA